MRFGLPGLWNTVVAPELREAPLRLGAYGEYGLIESGFGFQDPGFAPNISSYTIKGQLALKVAKGFAITASVPYRSWEVAATDSTEVQKAEGMGDVELAGSIRLFNLFQGAFQTGLWGMVRLPTGDTNRGLSSGETEGEYGLHTRLALFRNSVVPEFRWHANVGYRINKNDRSGYGYLNESRGGVDSTGVWAPVYPPAEPFDDARSNDMLLLRTALEFQKSFLSIWLEYSVDWLNALPDITYQENTQWLTPGLQIGGDGTLAFKAMWALALWVDDPGTTYRPNVPEWVFSASLSLPIFLGGRDRDDDGIPDKDDACPSDPEDIDGFMDADGCPDFDNDNDGITDLMDLAPSLAEDVDGFEDGDGRPDLDNDFDGIADVDDQCPNQPEDYDGFEDDDGCPDVVRDADGDGIEDAQDICPTQAEDFDGFEDDDGCPDLDNDLDGIPDVRDDCPGEREDYDGDRDDDGCPDDDLGRNP